MESTSRTEENASEPIIKSQNSFFDPILLSTSCEIFMFDLMYHPMFLATLSTLPGVHLYIGTAVTHLIGTQLLEILSQNLMSNVVKAQGTMKISYMICTLISSIS